MKKVYIASPYTLGDVAVNVKLQIDTASELIAAGFAVFWPLSSHFLHMAHPQDYPIWTQQDLEWVASCDVLLRIGGESKGADREVEYARELGKEVFCSVNDLTRRVAIR